MVVVGHGMQTGAHLASWALKAAGFSCSTKQQQQEAGSNHWQFW